MTELWNKDKNRAEKFNPVDASEILGGKHSCYCKVEDKDKKPAGRPAKNKK